MESYMVVWRGPFTFDRVLEEGDNDEEDLYVIAHLPPKRAPRTLYVGQTYEQYISDRLRHHHVLDAIWEKYGERSIRFFLGKVKLKRGQRRSRARIADIEAAIICNHGDELEFNIQNTATYSGRNLAISHRGSVPPNLENFDTRDW